MADKGDMVNSGDLVPQVAIKAFSLAVNILEAELHWPFGVFARLFVVPLDGSK